MSSSDGRPAARELTIGLFGTRSIVDLMSEAGDALCAQHPGEKIRFLTGVNATPGEARERFERLSGRIDAAVFPGPLFYDQAGAAGYRSVPSSYVRFSGEALYATLLRGVLHDGLDPHRVSIDSLPAASVHEAYRELRLPADAVEILPYETADDATRFEAFHRSALASGRVDCALTTVRSVEASLRRDGLRVLPITPTLATVREAVEDAVAGARHSRAEDQQVAFIIVQILGAPPGGPGSSAYWEQEAGLDVLRLLIDHARTVGATVARRSDTQFVVTTTAGGLHRLTDGLARAPFLVPAGSGIPLAIGLGTGSTAREAEDNAFAAVDLSVRGDGRSAWALDADGTRAELSRRAQPASRGEDAENAELVLTLAAGSNEAAPELGADDVARILGVSVRSGHRTVRRLVDAGLAWPLPTRASPAGGRPRQRYRLLTHKLKPPIPEENP